MNKRKSVKGVEFRKICQENNKGTKGVSTSRILRIPPIFSAIISGETYAITTYENAKKVFNQNTLNDSFVVVKSGSKAILD